MFQLVTRFGKRQVRTKGSMEDCINYIRDKYVAPVHKDNYDKYIKEGKFDLFLIALGLDLEET